MILLSS